MGVIFEGVSIPIIIGRTGTHYKLGWLVFNSLWQGAVHYIPFIVAGAWLTLAASGHWRSERSWIDRLGRALGTYWLAYIGIDVLAPVLAPLFRFLQ